MSHRKAMINWFGCLLFFSLNYLVRLYTALSDALSVKEHECFASFLARTENHYATTKLRNFVLTLWFACDIFILAPKIYTTCCPFSPTGFNAYTMCCDVYILRHIGSYLLLSPTLSVWLSYVMQGCARYLKFREETEQSSENSRYHPYEYST